MIGRDCEYEYKYGCSECQELEDEIDKLKEENQQQVATKQIWMEAAMEMANHTTANLKEDEIDKLKEENQRRRKEKDLIESNGHFYFKEENQKLRDTLRINKERYYTVLNAKNKDISDLKEENEKLQLITIAR